MVRTSLAGVSEDWGVPIGSGLSAVELSTMNCSSTEFKAGHGALNISLISVSSEGSHVKVPSPGPGNSFSICL